MDTDLRNVTRDDLWDLLGLQNRYFLQVIVGFQDVIGVKIQVKFSGTGYYLAESLGCIDLEHLFGKKNRVPAQT